MIRIVRARTLRLMDAATTGLRSTHESLRAERDLLQRHVRTVESLNDLALMRARDAETDRDAAYDRLREERGDHGQALAERDRRLQDLNTAALTIAADLLDKNLDGMERQRRIAAVLVKYGAQFGIEANMRPFLPDVKALASGAPSDR
ncbi:hypothetical protein [Streptomyces violascens]|uniref:hypothetical protein n=1 Tax=Streptomyces violascens TaxID=67381 RepID=UPI0036C50A6E